MHIAFRSRAWKENSRTMKHREIIKYDSNGTYARIGSSNNNSERYYAHSDLEIIRSLNCCRVFSAVLRSSILRVLRRSSRNEVISQRIVPFALPLNCSERWRPNSCSRSHIYTKWKQQLMNCSDPGSVVCASNASKMAFFVRLFLSHSRFEQYVLLAHNAAGRPIEAKNEKTKWNDFGKQWQQTAQQMLKKWMHSPCGAVRTNGKKSRNKSRNVDDNWLTFIVFGGIDGWAFDASNNFFWFIRSVVRCVIWLKESRARAHSHKPRDCGVAVFNRKSALRFKKAAHCPEWERCVCPTLFAAQKAKSISFHFYWRAVCYLLRVML